MYSGKQALRFETFKASNIGGLDKELKERKGSGKYDSSIRNMIFSSPPDLFISGHSHILKVMPDKSLHLLHINPGAAGLMGWQKERTLIRLTIEGNKFTDCEVITLGTNKSQL